MFKNQYDTDITTWSPDGKLYQVEYSMEAVKQGSCAVGLKNKKYVVLGSLKRAPHVTLSSYQGKLFEISSKIGIAVAGLAADGRVLCKFLRREALTHEYVYSSNPKVTELVDLVSKKSQANTQRYGRRAYGVGLLVAGYQKEPKLYQTLPSGVVHSLLGAGIGARSQSARTYIEKNKDSILNCSDARKLMLHALRSLQKTTTENTDLTSQNVELALLGEDRVFTMFDGKNNTEDLKDMLAVIKEEVEKKQKEEDGGGDDDGDGEDKMDLDKPEEKKVEGGDDDKMDLDP